jgi:hypothetical protein
MKTIFLPRLFAAPLFATPLFAAPPAPLLAVLSFA